MKIYITISYKKNYQQKHIIKLVLIGYFLLQKAQGKEPKLIKYKLRD